MLNPEGGDVRDGRMTAPKSYGTTLTALHGFSLEIV